MDLRHELESIEKKINENIHNDIYEIKTMLAEIKSAIISNENNLYKEWPSNFSTSVALEYHKHREKCKASVTQRAYDSIGKEITKACSIYNVTVDECLKLAMSKPWKGFKAEWCKDEFEVNLNDIPIIEIVELYNNILSNLTFYKIDLLSKIFKKSLKDRWENGNEEIKSIEWWEKTFILMSKRLINIDPQFRPKRYRLDQFVANDFEEVMNEISNDWTLNIKTLKEESTKDKVRKQINNIYDTNW